ncbi:hypothetical protein [Chryseosolibacter indicus]|uniref:Lipoprotein n=1 Tax=Chryseosolibacter indicus TaxID=2782351 RepID=A0ABS5VN64_9BACT|nr:hypothetical protein [Chryseosolibacter indicus]MBT1702184.1 hypothetical protein [Chryseosolibacter indicus]
MEKIKLLLLLTLVINACNNTKEAAIDYSNEVYERSIVNAVYEGRIPVGEDRFLYLELALFPGSVDGEGTYSLEEVLEDKALRDQPLHLSKGMYTISYGYGEKKEDYIIQLHNSSHSAGLKRVYSASNKIYEETFRKTDLVLLSEGNKRLLVLDKESNPITREREYNLTQRASKLFTVEGYFTYKSDTADFYEVNTRENMAITRLGAYYEACRQYHELTEKKAEPIYLKAVGFMIKTVDAKGKETEALVLKRIIQTSSVAPSP